MTAAKNKEPVTTETQTTQETQAVQETPTAQAVQQYIAPPPAPLCVSFQTVGEDNADIIVAVNGDQRQFQRDIEIQIGDGPGQIPEHFVNFLKNCKSPVQKKRRNRETGKEEEYHDEVLRFPFTIYQ